MSELAGVSEITGAGKPLDRIAFVRRERERKALSLYLEGKSFSQIKKALNLRSSEVARELVAQGGKRYESEEEAMMPAYRAMLTSDLLELRGIAMRMARDDNLGAIDRLVKISERMSRLLGFEKEQPREGPQIVVIDSRAPWERSDVVEGEAVENAQLVESVEGETKDAE